MLLSFLTQKNHHIFLKQEDLSQCTHLAIGAHPDDLEIMAGHGIEACYQSSEWNFVGVTVTTGGGSSASRKDIENLAETRRWEQIEAAKMGDYLACFQLAHESEKIKNSVDQSLVDELKCLFEKCQPKVIYTHNPFDKHKTHVAVWAHVMLAVKALNLNPNQMYGCEVWRGLDWLGDDKKILLPVKKVELIEALICLHKSQNHSHKSYAKATLGRMRANATFFDAYQLESGSHAICALDLKPFLKSPEQQIKDTIQEFQRTIENTFGGFVEDLKWR